MASRTATSIQCQPSILHPPRGLQENNVSLTLFQALDRTVESGNTPLTGKDIAGTGKSATTLLEEMCTSGLLDKTAAKSPKYTLTAKGRETWEREASAERRREVAKREDAARLQALTDLLAAVEKKKGKILTKSDLQKIPPHLLHAACDQKLVGIGPRENSYVLLPAGEEMLLATQPFERQLERLRQLHQEITSRWRAAEQRMGQDMDNSEENTLRSAAQRLVERGRTSLQELDSAMSQVGGIVEIAEVVRQVRTQVETDSRQAQQAIVAESERLAALEAQLREEASQLREQMASFERQAEARLAEMATKLESASPVAVAPPPEQSKVPAEEVAWQAVRTAHEQLRQENLRVGGIVKIPELTDAVVKGVEGLSTSQVHELLQRWQQEDKLTLQLCNDPRLEPRASEGIDTSRGLLFYVHMR